VAVEGSASPGWSVAGHHPHRIIGPNPLLKAYVAERLPLIPSSPRIVTPISPFFSSLLSCSLSRVRTQLFVAAAAEGAGSEVRTAGDRTRRRRLNKLSWAD
jgi:hypothetical protein